MAVAGAVRFQWCIRKFPYLATLLSVDFVFLIDSYYINGMTATAQLTKLLHHAALRQEVGLMMIKLSYHVH